MGVMTSLRHSAEGFKSEMKVVQTTTPAAPAGGPLPVLVNVLKLNLTSFVIQYSTGIEAFPKRFRDAQSADLDRKGAADFHRQLVKGDLASEYEHDLRLWLAALN